MHTGEPEPPRYRGRFDFTEQHPPEGETLQEVETHRAILRPLLAFIQRQ